MAAICHIILSKIKNLIFKSGAGINMHHHAKFNQNRSKGCRDMAILCFLKWRPSAIWNLWNSNFLTLGEVNRPILHQRTKFRKDRSNLCRDIAIFVFFFKMAAAAILAFQNFTISTVDPLPGANMRHRAKFHKFGRTVSEIWRCNRFFSKWRPSDILDLLSAYWDHSRWPLDGLYRCAKFG